MARPTKRLTFSLERLESREVMTAGGPTAEMQQMLELTNFARQHPADAANWAFSDLQTDNLGVTLQAFKVNVGQAKRDIASRPAVQPLAWNDQLASAADTLSRYQAESGQQTHTGSGGTLSDGTPVGVTLGDRISNAHYNNATSSGENAFAYANSVENSMKAFLIDWGNDPAVKPHMTNIFKPEYSEAGFGIVNTKNKGLGPKVITQDFGSRAGQKAMLVGVVYDDSVNPNHMYDIGEGRGNVAINITDSQGRKQTVQTWDAGGYQIALDPGHYTVQAVIGNKVVRTQGIDINDQNVKVDFNLADPWENTDLTPPVVSTPAPPPPAPVVVTPPPTVVITRDVPRTNPTPVVVVPVVTPPVATPPVVKTPAPVVATPAPTTPPPVTTEAAVVVDPLNAFQGLSWQSW